MYRIFSYLFVVVIIFAAGPAFAQMETPAKQAVMIDYDTGTVLLDKNADERMPTSSMSKVMTMYVVSDAIKNGRIHKDDMLTVSEKAWRMGGSKMFIEVGKQVKVEDLIQGVIVQSGNDATVVLAEGVAGTESAFADMLNTTAQHLGMKNSHFMNASGWPDPDHYSTARDLATLAWHTIHDFPDEYHYYSELEYTYNNIHQPNRNPLLFRGIGADGIKTGHTEDGGYGVIGSGVMNGRRVILVVNGLASEKDRAQESARLLEWGLKAFKNVSLFKEGATVASIPVALGDSNEVPATVDKDLGVTIPASVRNDMKVEAVYDSPLKAPVKKGQNVGLLRITVPRLPVMEVPLVAAYDVKPMNAFSGVFAKMKILMGGV